MRSERVEEYLEAIFRRQKTEMLVSTSTLAADLGVSLPAVTDMIQRLKTDGLIQYEPNKGVSLTAEGSRTALSTIRRHRLWERFLTDILGLKWDKVHDEACRLEHATSPETEKRLASLLGDADTCPHGHPIPDENGNIKDQNVRALSEFEAGKKVLISAVENEDGRLLRKIAKWGLKPKAIVKIEKKNDDGSLELTREGQTLRLDKLTADYLMATTFLGGKDTIAEEIPISRLLNGESGIFKTYTGEKAMLGRLISLGFTPDTSVRMIENFKSGPILVKIHNVAVALDREMATQITVTRSNPECP